MHRKRREGSHPTKEKRDYDRPLTENFLSIVIGYELPDLEQKIYSADFINPSKEIMDCLEKRINNSLEGSEDLSPSIKKRIELRTKLLLAVYYTHPDRIKFNEHERHLKDLLIALENMKSEELTPAQKGHISLQLEKCLPAVKQIGGEFQAKFLKFYHMLYMFRVYFQVMKKK